MAQIIVRNLEDSVRNGLRELARKNGHSMEEEARHILRAVVAAQSKSPEAAKVGLGTWISKQVAGIGLRDGEEIQELRGQRIKAPRFDR